MLACVVDELAVGRKAFLVGVLGGWGGVGSTMQ